MVSDVRSQLRDICSGLSMSLDSADLHDSSIIRSELNCSDNLYLP